MTDEPGRDPHLLQALRHAPDAATPPEAVRAAILRAARAPAAVAPARRWWQAIARPPFAAAFASVAMVTVAALLWHGEPVPSPAGPGPDREVVSPVPPPQPARPEPPSAPERRPAAPRPAPQAAPPLAEVAPQPTADAAVDRPAAAAPARGEAPLAAAAPVTTEVTLAALVEAVRQDEAAWSMQRDAATAVPADTRLHDWLALLASASPAWTAAPTPPLAAAELHLRHRGQPVHRFVVGDDGVWWFGRQGVRHAPLDPALAARLKAALPG